MRSIAFLSQKGGVGRTTLAASLAVAAAGAGERVIALDLDPQASLVSWGERRKAANTPNKLVIEPLESERLPLLHTPQDGRLRQLQTFVSCRRARRAWTWM